MTFLKSTITVLSIVFLVGSSLPMEASATPDVNGQSSIIPAFVHVHVGGHHYRHHHRHHYRHHHRHHGHHHHRHHHHRHHHGHHRGHRR